MEGKTHTPDSLSSSRQIPCFLTTVTAAPSRSASCLAVAPSASASATVRRRALRLSHRTPPHTLCNTLATPSQLYVNRKP